MRTDKLISTKLSAIKAEIFWHKCTKFGSKIFTRSKDIAICVKSSIFKANNAAESHNNSLHRFFDKISNKFCKSCGFWVHERKPTIFYAYLVTGNAKTFIDSLCFSFWSKCDLNFEPHWNLYGAAGVMCNKRNCIVACNQVCIENVGFVFVNPKKHRL